MKFAPLFALSLVFAAPVVHAETLDVEAVNAAKLEGETKKVDPVAVVRLQILLDRQHYSPGVIDGFDGEATGIALKAFQADNNLEPSGKIDAATFAKLVETDPEPVLIRHTITAEDVKGPFIEKVPTDIAEMAKLEHMSYTSPRELLSERFHMDQDLLQKLNPDADFAREGTEINVAAVESAQKAQQSGEREKAERIVVDKSERTLRIFGKDNALLALYPATIGSEQNPAPDGELTVERVAKDPTWNYDPKLKLEGDKERPDEKMTVQPGPNNPVGAVWIALSKDHYGIHGTPEPDKVGKNLSSGCVRMTNWDVLELAGLVEKGTPVVFEE